MVVVRQKGLLCLLVLSAFITIGVTGRFPGNESNSLLDPVFLSDGNEKLIGEAIDRAIVQKQIRQEWEHWKKKRITETPSIGNKPKEIRFDATKNTKLKDIFHYLQHFPLLEIYPVKYTIPVDGKEVKLLLTHDTRSGSFNKFRAKYLYPDPSDPTGQRELQTDLVNPKDIMQELISSTKDHVELRNAIQSAIPEILKQGIKDKDTFKDKLEAEIKKTQAQQGKKPHISDDIRTKAFRHALEAMMCTSVMRRQPETWISEVNKKIQATNNDISIKEEVKNQWADWKTNGLFTEVAATGSDPKIVIFKKGSKVSVNEIFHSLQYFTDLEAIPERTKYSIPIDGKRFELELAPDGSGGFTANSMRRDPNNIQNEHSTDLSKIKPIVDALDYNTGKHFEIQVAITSSFNRIFNFPENHVHWRKNNFEHVLSEQTAISRVTIPRDEQKRSFREAVELVAASTILKKKMPTGHFIEKMVDEKIKPEMKKIDEKFKAESVKKTWKGLKSKAFIEDSTKIPKTVTFKDDADISVKEIFQYLRYFPHLENAPVIYKIPVDGQEINLKLEPDGTGKFTAKYIHQDQNGKTLETDLSKPDDFIHDLISSTEPRKELREALESALPKILKKNLKSKDTFNNAVKKKIGTGQIPDDVKNKAFRQSMETMASSVILGNEPETWINGLNKEMEKTRNEVEDAFNERIKNNQNTLLKFELAASTLRTTEEAKAKWAYLVAEGFIEEKFDSNNRVTEIKFNENAPLTIKGTFKLLQHFNQLYPNQGYTKAQLKIPIGGEERTVYISKSNEDLRGKEQVTIEGKNKHWQWTREISTDSKGKLKTDNQHISTSYDEIIHDRALKNFPDTKHLADVMLESIHGKLNEQPNFDTKLEIKDSRGRRKNTKTLDTIRGTVEFMLISMIGEAAHIPEYVESAFKEKLANRIKRKREFPKAREMPSLEHLGRDAAGDTIKAGRSPTADEVVIKLLNEMKSSGIRFDLQFQSSSNKFPFMDKVGGTKKGRLFLFDKGDQPIPSSIAQERAATDDVGSTMAKRARISCTGSSKRKKRDICSLEQIDKNMIVDESSIKVEDTKVALDIVDRRDATKRKHLEIKISPDELATSKLVKQRLAESKRTDVSQKYAKINRGLAVHGMVFSAIGAIDYFKRGDNVRGGIAVSQSLHSLGGLTGFNKIASSAAKQALRHSAFKIAKGLKMEKGLARFSSKVEKFMEKGVGRLMGDLPGVGLAFDIYFIKEDIDELSTLDLNNPEDVKMLPLRVVDLVLDVDTTVLNLIGTFCPAAEVITEPLIIVLSIVRMAIDDFYVDIMEEMDKVNWNSPWAGFEFIGALFKGIIEGAVDFLTGGLRKQMENYSKQEKQDQKFISSLKDVTNYFTITGNKANQKTIDFTKGKLAQFGGFINFRLNNDGTAHLEVGDVTGKHETIKRTFKIGDDVNDIVLGIGESRKFVYETKTAKLWMFIPVKNYKVIKGADLRASSLYGIYYGNDESNKFYAVQGNHTEKGNDQIQQDYGKFNINFATGHYHYDLYGRGGSDTFFLGPQLSHVTGGLGRDVYIVQSYGGNTVIDNFSEDKERDMVIINVQFKEISCHKNNVDLHILYKKTHHIRITNWFVPGSPTYYRHISFKSIDGIIFLAKDYLSEVKCAPIAIEKSGKTNGEDISLEQKDFLQVKQVVGTQGDDTIHGNDLNNILDGGKGDDLLMGGRNEDTYIIRATEGCDRINNNADDYKTTTDVIVFDVPYERIALKISGNDLLVFDTNAQFKRSSCFTIEKWMLGEQYRHLILTSSDHVVFKIKQEKNKHTKFPMVLDYSSSPKGVKVDLRRKPRKGYINEKGFDQVATISDSKHSDHLLGNKQSNFLSCTGGKDYLVGYGGSDNYIVKKSCKLAVIINWDSGKKVDLLLLDYNFQELRGKKYHHDFYIYYDVVHPKVILKHWYSGTRFQHLWMRTRDGITVKISNTTNALIPVEISKDPVECQCKETDCQRTVIQYDLNEDPWKHVTRFQLNSSYCSYRIKGNDLNNYIDPGSGNGYNFQHLEGRGGADTYVLKHGYGEFNIINNYAKDKKKDTLKLGLELNDIQIFFHGSFDVMLTSKARPSSLAVRLNNYFLGSEYQHLQVITSDQVTFEIKKEDPFMKIITLDLSRFDSPQSLSSKEMQLASQAQTLQGVDDFSNTINGTASSKEIDGGSKDDIISGGPADNIIDGKGGNDKISGNEGDDILFGGDGDDTINGGDGNDYIYGGDGKDSIDGGPGDDTMVFKGDSFEKKGVYVDLSGGFGKNTDAEGDTYKNVENVYGTIQNDILIGSDSDNNLYGGSGEDVIIAKGGSDKLVGGDGSDRYILDDAYGVKIIDNYSEDKQKDTLSLSNIDSNDICIFLVGNDLHLTIERTSLSNALYDSNDLTVIIQNWNARHQHRHLNILFKNTYWPNHILALVREDPNRFRQLGPIVRHVGTYPTFKFMPGNPNNGVGLSWKPIAPLLLDEKTQLSLFHVDIDNPKNIGTTEIAGNAVDRGQWVDTSQKLLKKDKHYMLALFLKYCSKVVASSYSLTYYGQKKSCSQISVENSMVIYKPQGSYLHGTKASLICKKGYKLNSNEVAYKQTCLDGKWHPQHPTCVLEIRCPRSNDLTNGVVTFQRTVDGSDIAHYSCDKGFKLQGSPMLQCKDKGMWSGEKPTCQRMSCLRIPKVKNGIVTECKRISDEYGTMEEPKQDFCVKITCNPNYIEEFKVNDLATTFKIYIELAKKLKGQWFCRNEKWKGAGEPKCVPSVRLNKRVSSWHVDRGILQQWDDSKNQWIDSLSDDTCIYKLACSNSVGMDDYNGTPKVVRKSNQLEVSCPKIRFVDKITPYEGSLEVLVNKMWQPTCLLAATEDAQNTQKLKSAYQTMCKDLGVDAHDPGIAYIGHGATNQVMMCKKSFTNINDCMVKPHPMTDCIYKLQCRRRCDNSYPVPNAETVCNGKFEDDQCEVRCKLGFRLAGSRTVYCKKGVWSKSNGEIATSRCDQDHEETHKETNDVLEEVLESISPFSILG